METALTPPLRRQALEAAHGPWTPRSLAQALDDSTRRHGARPLVITDDRSYTYAEVQAWSRRLAAGLLALGLAPGDHVAVVMANYPAFVAVKFALARIGAVAVPINYLLRANELRYVLSQSDSKALITMDGLRDRNYLADLDALMPGWETQGGGQAFPLLRHVVVFHAEGQPRPAARSLEQLADAGSDADQARLQRLEQEVDPLFRSDVVYTSGTTGSPKGVMLSHDMVLRAAYASAYTRAFQDRRRILFSLPMYHVFGYVECLVACLFVGGAVIPHVVFDPQHMAEAAQRHAANEIVCVPMMTLKLLELVRERGFDGRHLTTMFNSGGASPPTLWQDIRRLLGAREVITGYGMSETTASTTCTLPEGPDERLLTSNGRLKLAGRAGDPALGGVLALYKTVDPETGADLPVGTPGELVARGPIVTPGYYNKPDETRAAFNAEGWLHTGDVGVVDADGYLTLTGRIKETYRCGGEMVMPREIEDLLNGHPQVAQALVVGLPDPKMGEVGCVCVVPKGDTRPEPAELIALCASHLARFKVPRHVVFIAPEEIPLTATGRPQKFLLQALAQRRLADTQPQPTT